MSSGLSLDVRGLSRTYYLLGQVDKDLRRQFYGEIGSLVKRRVEAAKASMPVGDQGQRQQRRYPPGRPSMAATTLLSKTSNKKFKAMNNTGGYRKGLFGFLAVSKTGHSIIMDFAQKASTPQGASLIRTLNARYGPAPRFLGRQFLGEQNRAALYRQSEDLVKRYVAKANNHIEAASRAGAA